MERLENKPEVIRPFLGRPLLWTSKAYKGNGDNTLGPAYARVGLLNKPNPKEGSLWIFGPSLRVKPPYKILPEFQIYDLMGAEYLLFHPSGQACIYGHGGNALNLDKGDDVYAFTSDLEGLELIEKIKNGLPSKSFS